MTRLFQFLRLISNTRFLPRRIQSGLIIRETAKKKFDVVVDIGCGAAPHKKFISYTKYIGVDIEDRGGVSGVILADINNGIPLPDATADLVVCTETLEHTKEPHFVVRELFRITKPGGTVLLTAPMVWPVHEAPYDFFRYTNFGLQYLFEQAGFSAIRSQASNGYIYSMCALLQLYMRHVIFFPLVMILNIVGLLSYRMEKNTNFSLGQQIIAKK